ncbi:hypothetical protein DUNSADRAFT_9938, partial [Dunaliella salina]
NYIVRCNCNHKPAVRVRIRTATGITDSCSIMKMSRTRKDITRTNKDTGSGRRMMRDGILDWWNGPDDVQSIRGHTSQLPMH